MSLSTVAALAVMTNASAVGPGGQIEFTRNSISKKLSLPTG